MPPSFDEVEYWNARFAREEEFEWLSGPDDILSYIKAALSNISEEHQNILHIGSGSSSLSLTLRGLLSSPQKVHNVDYSETAIRLGKTREQQVFVHDQKQTMKWTCSDLLNDQNVGVLIDGNPTHPGYSLIIDKSTTDSISCGQNVILDSSKFRTTDEYGITKRCSYAQEVHPVNLLALHLAVIASPGAYWLCVSYSNDRFPFLNDREEPCDITGALDPAKYWRLERIEPILLKNTEETSDRSMLRVHRPQVTHWIYTLRRTNKSLGFFTAA